MKLPKLFVMIILLLQSHLLEGYPTEVHFDGVPIRWPISKETPKIYFEIAGDGAQANPNYAAFVMEAAEMWTSVSGAYIELLPQSSDDEKTSISVNIGGGSIGEYAAAYTEYDSIDASGLQHCTIYLRSSGIDAYHFAKSILHEFGHCLGLGHSLIPESVMSYYLEENGFYLAIDDEAALSRLYPEQGEFKMPQGCAVADYGTKKLSSAQGLLMFLMMVLPLFYISLLAAAKKARKL